jgi:hypothetical protein
MYRFRKYTNARLTPRRSQTQSYHSMFRIMTRGRPVDAGCLGSTESRNEPRRQTGYDRVVTERWSPAERSILRSLAAAVLAPETAVALRSISERVLATLARGSREIEAWEAVPLDLYDAALPSEIKSSWVFVLRHGVTTGAERHPKSRQRMMSWSGAGDFQVHDGKRWESHHLVSDPSAPLERRWISIPPETWHQGVVGEEDWLVVSFHTVAAEELIEERPDPADPDPFHPHRTRRRKYVDAAQP